MYNEIFGERGQTLQQNQQALQNAKLGQDAHQIEFGERLGMHNANMNQMNALGNLVPRLPTLNSDVQGFNVGAPNSQAAHYNSANVNNMGYTGGFFPTYTNSFAQNRGQFDANDGPLKSFMSLFGSGMFGGG